VSPIGLTAGYDALMVCIGASDSGYNRHVIVLLGFQGCTLENQE
jgi:hypothetical protein